MPAKTRAKAVSRGRPQRLPTQFGELETTPTSRHHQPESVHDPLLSPRHAHKHEPQTPAEASKYDDGLDDVDLAGLEDLGSAISETRRRASFQWSETESMARRSSPLSPGETPTAAWQFDGDESLPPLSTPRSGQDKLPDTAPLPGGASALTQPEVIAATKKVDFSETASTMRRSSPAGLDDSVKDIFDFYDDSAFGFAPDVPSCEHDGAAAVPPSTRRDIPVDIPTSDIYDATPLRANGQRDRGAELSASPAGPRETHKVSPSPALLQQSDGVKRPEKAPVVCKQKPEHPEAGQVNNRRAGVKKGGAGGNNMSPPETTHGTTSKANNNNKPRKRKQRPKPPLQFDEVSHELKEPPGRATAQSPQKPRMPIVTALRDSAQPSSPQTQGVVPQKRGAAVRNQPRKKAKKTSTAGKQQTPQLETKTAQLSPEGEQECMVPPKKQPARAGQASRQTKASHSQASQAGQSSLHENLRLIVVSSDDDCSPAKIAVPRNGKPQDVSRPRANPNRLVAEEAKMVESPPPLSPLVPPIPEESRRGVSRVMDAESRPHLGQVGTADSNRTRDVKVSASRVAQLPKQKAHPETNALQRDDVKHGGRPSHASRLPSRNFSISAHGSPLPANDHETQAGSNIFAEPGKPRLEWERSPPRFPQASRLKVAAEGRGTGETCRVQVAQGPTCQSSQRQRAMAATAATAPLQGIAGDVHAQILASLEEHRIHSEEHLINGRAVGGGGSGGRDNGQDPQADERGNPADDLSRQLHQVIGAMLKHLRSKEEAGHRIPEIYRTNTTGCVEKIGNRQGQERKALAETMRGDADKFRHVVGKARRAVVDNRRRWESGLAELQQTTDRRQAMYERAATSLRALHRQLLDGAEAKGKGKGAFLQKQQAETTGGESMTSGQGPAA